MMLLMCIIVILESKFSFSEKSKNIEALRHRVILIKPIFSILSFK
jgi:hypothetical protein